MPFQSRSTTLFALTCIALLCVPSPAAAGNVVGSNDTLPLDVATIRLKAASVSLKDTDASPKDVKKSLEELAKAHANAGGKDRERDAFRRKAEGVLLKALTIRRTTRRERDANLLVDVNVAAGKLLGGTADVLNKKEARSLSSKIRSAIAKTIEKQRKPEQWDAQHLEVAFQALASLNDYGTLVWMVDSYRHSKEREIPFLIAAHRAMIGFRDVPGKVRHHACERLIAAYAGVESAAERASNSATDAAKKRIWDRLRLYTVPALQHYAGKPTDAEGKALSTVGDLRDWWQDHKSPRDKAWKD